MEHASLITEARRVVHPTLGFFEGFIAQAEEFRRALLRSPRVNSTRELDRISELTGDLIIEVGKVTGRVAMKFHRLVVRDVELTRYLERLPEPQGSAQTLGGFVYLVERMSCAKDFSRRNGRATLVRELNVFMKDAFFVLNEIVLDHVNALDTLMTEAFAQYGIACEEPGEREWLRPHRLEQAGKPSPHPSPVGAS